MNLCINQVLEWLPDNETAQIFRVLWIEQSGTDVVTIELLNSKANTILSAQVLKVAIVQGAAPKAIALS